MTLFTRGTQVSRLSIFFYQFEFSLHSAELKLGYFYLAPMIFPRGYNLALFYRKFINCLLKPNKYGRKAILSTKSCSFISELEDN